MASTIWAPAARRSPGVRLLTVPCVAIGGITRERAGDGEGHERRSTEREDESDGEETEDEDRRGAGRAQRAEQAGADVRPDHRTDFGHEDGVMAEDRLACLDQPLRVLRVLDVLDDPRVRAVLVALARVVDHPLERAAR